MAHGSKVCWLGLLLLASSASATTVGHIQGRPVPGRPLEVNIPFAVDEPTDRACASANVRYGDVPMPRVTLHVQGHGLKRNVVVISHANVNEPTVTVNVRVGCGAKAVKREFAMLASTPVAYVPPVAKPVARHGAPDVVAKPAAKPAVLAQTSEPLFPPSEPETVPKEEPVPKADPGTMEELHKAQTDASAAASQLQATRRELDAVLDVERRTQQTLIDADRQIRDANSEVAHMRLVLKRVGAALGLAAVGRIWFELNRMLMAKGLRPRAVAMQEEDMLVATEMPT